MQKISGKSKNPHLSWYDSCYFVGLLEDNVPIQISKQHWLDDYVEIESRDVVGCSIKMNIVQIEGILQQKFDECYLIHDDLQTTQPACI